MTLNTDHFYSSKRNPFQPKSRALDQNNYPLPLPLIFLKIFILVIYSVDLEKMGSITLMLFCFSCYVRYSNPSQICFEILNF